MNRTVRYWRRGSLAIALSIVLCAAQAATDPKEADGWFQRATGQMNIRARECAPFHMKIVFHAYAGLQIDAKQKIMTGDGNYEETWLAPHQWRREVGFGSYHAVEVQSGGVRKMQASSDYEPSRVLMLLQGLYNPIPRTYLDPSLNDFPFAWKVRHQTVGGIEFVRISRLEYGTSQEFSGRLAATYSFLAKGLLFESDELGLVTTWQDEVAFAGKAVPRRFSVQAMGRKLLEAEVSIERVADTSAAIFDLPVAQAEPGMTLRPMQIEETRGLRNLDGSFSFSTRAPSNSRATLREIIDRHGAVREVEFLDAQDTSNAASLFGGFEHMRWKPGQQDGSPCELVVNQRLSG